MGGSWEQIQDWPQELCAIQGVFLPSGKVLLWGVQEINGPTVVRLWDPATNAFENVNNSTWIWCCGHTGLSDGLALTAGGTKVGGTTGDGIKETYLFDESEDPPWRQARDMFYERWYPTCTALADGSDSVVGGSIAPPPPQWQWASTPEVYIPEADEFVALADADKELPFYPFMFLLPSGKLAVTGRHGEPSGFSGDLNTLTLDIATQTWVTVDTTRSPGANARLRRCTSLGRWCGPAGSRSGRTTIWRPTTRRSLISQTKPLSGTATPR